MKKVGRKSLALILALILIASLATSCVSNGALIERFTLEAPTQTETTTKILTGTVSYGAGIYFPSSNDLLDISLLKTDATTGTIQEISHQRIRNIQKFPLQFSLRYEKTDLNEGDSCSLLVTLSVNGSVSAQAMVRLEITDGVIAEAALVLSSTADLLDPKS